MEVLLLVGGGLLYYRARACSDGIRFATADSERLAALCLLSFSWMKTERCLSLI